MPLKNITIADIGVRIPQNIYCVGRNYGTHAKELGNAIPTAPIIFLKSLSSLRALASGALAFTEETFHYEAELVLSLKTAVSLGSKCGWEVVEAIGLGIDLTRREIQNNLKREGMPWTVAKSFTGSALVSEFSLYKEGTPLEDLSFSLKINGTLRQEGHPGDMIFDVPTLLSYLATFNELAPADLVFTGTPAGVGTIHRGDTFELEFPCLGKNYLGKL